MQSRACARHAGRQGASRICRSAVAYTYWRKGTIKQPGSLQLGLAGVDLLRSNGILCSVGYQPDVSFSLIMHKETEPDDVQAAQQRLDEYAALSSGRQPSVAAVAVNGGPAFSHLEDLGRLAADVAVEARPCLLNPC